MKLNDFLRANLNEAKLDITNLDEFETYLNQKQFDFIDPDGIDFDFEDRMVLDYLVAEDTWCYTKNEYSKVTVYYVAVGPSQLYMFAFSKKNLNRLTKATEWFNDEGEAFDPETVSDNINTVVKDFLKQSK